MRFLTKVITTDSGKTLIPTFGKTLLPTFGKCMIIMTMQRAESRD